MVRLIAGFGGFLGRKGDGHPGPKTLWEGLQRVQMFALGAVSYTHLTLPTSDLV